MPDDSMNIRVQYSGLERTETVVIPHPKDMKVKELRALISAQFSASLPEGQELPVAELRSCADALRSAAEAGDRFQDEANVRLTFADGDLVTAVPPANQQGAECHLNPILAPPLVDESKRKELLSAFKESPQGKASSAPRLELPEFLGSTFADALEQQLLSQIFLERSNDLYAYMENRDALEEVATSKKKGTECVDKVRVRVRVRVRVGVRVRVSLLLLPSSRQYDVLDIRRRYL